MARIWILAHALGCISGCSGGGCPKPTATAASQELWEQELDKRGVLKLDAKSDITIKRDVHNLVVSADAGPLAEAFHRVMRDPERHFGLIQVNRKRANVGKPFSIGERFQGRYVIADAIEQTFEQRWARFFGKLVENEDVRDAICAFENQHTSDYGIISQLQLSPGPEGEFRLAYRYLQGSPIAGSSTFVVTPLGAKKSRLTQIFEYQEFTRNFALFFSSGGLKLHNQVVYSQTKQAADLLGAQILESDIPFEYRSM